MSELTPPVHCFSENRDVTDSCFVVNPRHAFYLSALLMFGTLFPAEMAVRVGMVLSVYRFCLIITFLVIIPIAVRKIISGGYVPVISDIFVILLSLWAPLILYIKNGLPGLTSVYGLLGFELMVPYLLGRCVVGNVAGMQQLVRVMPFIVLVMLGLGCLDLIAGENIIPHIASNYFGNFRSGNQYANDQEAFAFTTQYRFGLPRVRGPIEHSILYGSYFANWAPILFYMSNRTFKKLFFLGVCGIGTLLSLSSAPILGFALFLTLAGYDALFRRVRARWSLLLLIAGVATAAVFLLLEDPLRALISWVTFDPKTGFARLVIWHWVGLNLQKSPIFGIGVDDWFRPEQLSSSIDSLWLNDALVYGYVGLALLVMVVLGTLFVWTPRKLTTYPNDSYSKASIGVGISLCLFTVLGFSVHIWGTMWGIFSLILGLRAGLTEAIYLPPERRGGI